MLRRVCILAAVGALGTLWVTSCGGGGGSSGSGDGSAFTWDHTGIVAIEGVPLHALYVIGGCNSTDDPQTNVTSYLAPGNVLVSPSGKCPGAPYSFAIVPDGPDVLDISVTVGPLPVRYATLSVPLDLVLDLDDKWSAAKLSGTYGSLLNGTPTTPREVRAGGPFGEVEGSWGTLRRTGDYPVWGFIVNPLVEAETVEPRWLDLHAGAVLVAHERLELTR